MHLASHNLSQVLKWAQTKHKSNKQTAKVSYSLNFSQEFWCQALKAFCFQNNLVNKACSIYTRYMDKKSQITHQFNLFF